MTSPPPVENSSEKLVKNPLARELNAALAHHNPAVFQMLSAVGKRLFFPEKGIVGQAAEAKQQAQRKYNATVGIATDAAGPLSFPSIQKFFKELSGSEIFDYSSSFGVPALRTLWKRRLEALTPSLEQQLISLPVVTNGLTHTVALLSELFFEAGDELILGDQMWGNYRLIFETRRAVTLRRYPFFAGGGFNVKGFEAALEESGKQHQTLRVLMNFPNNPTGYALTHREAEAVVAALKRQTERGKKVMVVLDEAYNGLFFAEGLYEKSLFGELAQLSENLLAVKVCGATKEFFVWGFRIGFLTYGVKRAAPPFYAALEKKTAGLIRATVSNCPTPSQNILRRVLADGSYQADFKKNHLLLQKRFNAVNKALKNSVYRQSFTAYPFNAGYFMLLRLCGSVSAEAVRRRLLEKEKIGVIATAPQDLRIAFSCLEEAQVPVVFEKIHAACQQLQTAANST